MVGNRLKIQSLSRSGLVLVSVLALSACSEDGTFNFGGEATPTDSANAAAAPSGITEERDIEAPEVFQLTETGLWDGRPSLGGVWVAHPSVTDPERVIIRNDANGKFVIGALFRRERDNPGPALQVSSDAAAELGLLAGAPAMLNVVALRREEAEVASIPPATTDFDTTSEGLDAPEEIATTSLDPIAGAAAAIDAAEATSPAGETAASIVAAAAATSAPAAPAAPAPAATSSLSKPFIQIGIFSVEANANRAAEMLRGDGMSANLRAQESNGRPFWRVVVGPAPTESDRAAILEKVKALGFADAYFVTN